MVTMSISFGAFAQSTIDVTFRYYSNSSAERAFVPGSFNNWGNNEDGRIAVNDGSLMTKDTVYGFWYKTISLNVGGGSFNYDGKNGYAYKFHEQYNDNGSDWQWFTDPLNPIAIGGNNDSFLEVTHPLIFQLQPAENDITDETSEIWATVAAMDSDSIDVQASRFYLNGDSAGTFEGFYDTDRQLFAITEIDSLDLLVGENELKIEAVTVSGATTSDSVSFAYLPDIDPVQKARPQYLRDGITYMDTGMGEVALSVFAPGKDYVFVIGDFNDWRPSEEYLMKKDSLNADSVWHWIEFSVPTGQEYAFQYLVDGELRIADPYSELVLDPNNDPYISEETFPDLLDYPEGKTSGYVSVLQPSKQAFNWEASDYVRPEKENLVIYELLLRDFLETSNYQTLTDSLDYLERLGVNAIELMPVNEFDGNLSWGYNPSFHLALDKYYGSPEAFRTFVDEAHKRGMAVILDVVLNHATGLNPLYQLYGGTNNPYFNATAKHDFNVFNDMNHEYSGTRYYSKRVMEYWLDEYNIDGYRFDLSKGFTQKNTLGNTGDWGQYDQSRVNIWKDYADHIWEVDSSAYVILEHFAENSEEKVLADYGMMLWGNMNHEYNEASMGYVSDLDGVLAESRNFNDRHLVGYMESHDEQWMMFKNIAFGNSAPEYNYDITEWGTALGRQKLVGAFFFTLPGPKMLWQFGELGYGYGNNGEQCLNDADYCPSTAPGRTAEKPIRWDYFNNPDKQERVKLYKTWSALINLRNSSPAFTNPETSAIDLSGSLKSLIYTHEDMDVVILGNFGMNPRTMEVEFPSTGTWYNYFEGDSIEVEEAAQSIEVGLGGFKVFTTKRYELTENDLATSVEEGIGDFDAPATFRLEQNYPNPFNPTTVISYQLAGNSEVSLKVFDVLGREVATLVNERKQAGSYSVNFDASHLSSGMYIYRLQASGKVFTQKMMLIK